MQQKPALTSAVREVGFDRRSAAWQPFALVAAWAMLGVAAPVCAQPATSELGGYVTVATDTRSRGLSQADGDTTVQVGLDYQHAGGFFAGAMLGNVGYPYDAARPRPRERLLEIYTGYLWRGADWGLTAALGHYRYPGTAFDYDYSELSAVVDFRDRYFYRFTYTDDLLSIGGTATGHELGFALALPASLELGASLGRFETGGAGPPGYTHYNVGLSRLVGRFGLDLRRYETSREIVGYIGSSAVDRWVFSVSYAIRPRP